MWHTQVLDHVDGGTSVFLRLCQNKRALGAEGKPFASGA
jgi:hypothetical protein